MRSAAHLQRLRRGRVAKIAAKLGEAEFGLVEVRQATKDPKHWVDRQSWLNGAVVRNLEMNR